MVHLGFWGAAKDVEASSQGSASRTGMNDAMVVGWVAGWGKQREDPVIAALKLELDVGAKLRAHNDEGRELTADQSLIRAGELPMHISREIRS